MKRYVLFFDGVGDVVCCQQCCASDDVFLLTRLVMPTVT